MVVQQSACEGAHVREFEITPFLARFGFEPYTTRTTALIRDTVRVPLCWTNRLFGFYNVGD